MKASLPVNTMVLLLIAIIVLVAVIFIITGIIRPGIGSLSTEQKLDDCCWSYVSSGCCEGDSPCNNPDTFMCRSGETLSELAGSVDVKARCRCPT